MFFVHCRRFMHKRRSHFGIGKTILLCWCAPKTDSWETIAESEHRHIVYDMSFIGIIELRREINPAKRFRAAMNMLYIRVKIDFAQRKMPCHSHWAWKHSNSHWNEVHTNTHTCIHLYQRSPWVMKMLTKVFQNRRAVIWLKPRRANVGRKRWWLWAIQFWHEKVASGC